MRMKYLNLNRRLQVATQRIQEHLTMALKALQGWQTQVNKISTRVKKTSYKLI